MRSWFGLKLRQIAGGSREKGNRSAGISRHFVFRAPLLHAWLLPTAGADVPITKIYLAIIEKRQFVLWPLAEEPVLEKLNEIYAAPVR